LYLFKKKEKAAKKNSSEKAINDLVHVEIVQLSKRRMMDK